MTAAEKLDETFLALADPTRRKVIELLRKKPQPRGGSGGCVGMVPPAMSRHLRILRTSGLVEERRLAGGRACARVSPARRALHELRMWLEEVEAFWTDQLQAFKAHAERPRTAPHERATRDPTKRRHAMSTEPASEEWLLSAPSWSSAPGRLRVFTQRDELLVEANAALPRMAAPTGTLALRGRATDAAGRDRRQGHDRARPCTGLGSRQAPGLRVAWRRADRGRSTQVEVRFDAHRSGTRVTLEHRGLEPAARSRRAPRPPGEAFAAMFGYSGPTC